MYINKSTLLNIANKRVPNCLFVSLFDIKQKVVWFMYLPYNGIKFLQVALIIYVSAMPVCDTRVTRMDRLNCG